MDLCCTTRRNMVAPHGDSIRYNQRVDFHAFETYCRPYYHDKIEVSKGQLRRRERENERDKESNLLFDWDGVIAISRNLCNRSILVYFLFFCLILFNVQLSIFYYLSMLDYLSLPLTNAQQITCFLSLTVYVYYYFILKI